MGNKVDSLTTDWGWSWGLVWAGPKSATTWQLNQKEQREREREKNGGKKGQIKTKSHKAWEHIFIDGGRSLSRLEYAVNLLPHRAATGLACKFRTLYVFPKYFQSVICQICLALSLCLNLSFSVFSSLHWLNLIGFYANFDPLSPTPARIFFLYGLCRVSFGTLIAIVAHLCDRVIEPSYSIHSADSLSLSYQQLIYNIWQIASFIC